MATGRHVWCRRFFGCFWFDRCSLGYVAGVAVCGSGHRLPAGWWGQSACLMVAAGRRIRWSHFLNSCLVARGYGATGPAMPRLVAKPVGAPGKTVALLGPRERLHFFLSTSRISFACSFFAPVFLRAFE